MTDTPPPGYPGFWPQQPTPHPQGTTVLVLGILSLVLCGLLGPFAWVQGNRALAEIDANPAAFSNRQEINVGRILGIVSTVMLAVGLAALVLMIVVMLLSGAMFAR